jgi:uncharacterized membrane protein
MAVHHSIAQFSTMPAHLGVRQIGPDDLKLALRRGWDDFQAMPSHLAFLFLFYPLFGIGLGALTFSADAFPLLFPLVSGFAIMGPLAAIGLYELSRRREEGLETSWQHAFEVLLSPALPQILGLGVILMVVFVAWVASAGALYRGLYGDAAPASYIDFLREIVTTSRGWTLIILGHLVGFVFAVATFSISVVSFQLLLDRKVGVGPAVATSLQLVRTNPRTMALWALIVAVALMIGSAPLLVGLAIVMPVLGHASWHLYRAAVEPPRSGASRPVGRVDETAPEQRDPWRSP